LAESKVIKEVGDILNMALGETAIPEGKAEAEESIVGIQRPTETPYGDIVGNSPAPKRIIHDASIVAETDSTALITGDTGTGHSAFTLAANSTRQPCASSDVYEVADEPEWIWMFLN
jgi:transcriptional regulator with GAF, ATPase, and Fis domain